jgi:hypothetical protein
MVLFLEVDGEQNWECLGWAVVHWTVHVLRTHESTTPLLKRVSYLYEVPRTVLQFARVCRVHWRHHLPSPEDAAMR